ncbi:hypothetical protein ABPG75_005057 [Micractinium tetrahymenae]
MRGPPASVGIQALDDSLLLRIMSNLDLTERLAGPALVCRNWFQLCMSRNLLQDLTVSLADNPASTLPRLRSLLVWLLRHAAAPRSVTLRLWHGDAAAAAPPQSGESAAEVVALLNSCATACASAERLTIVHSAHYIPNGWVVAQRGLREVRLRSRTRLHLLTTWEALEALQSLELTASAIVLAPGAALPASLTALTLAGDRGPHLPHQVGDLSNLRSLQLRGVTYDAGGFEVLRRLSSLQQLQLDRCRLPACLPALGSIRSLQLSGCTAGQGGEGELAAGVAAALRRLSQLTALALVQLPPVACRTASMVALRQLQSLTVLPCSNADGSSSTGGCRIAPLPSGMPPPPWPPGLRCLTAPFALVTASLAWLSTAHRLSQLRLTDCPSASGIAPAKWLAFFSWAEAHAPLVRLEFAAAPPQHAALLGKACARLAAKRPRLHLVARPPGQLPALAPQPGSFTHAANKA